MATVSWRWLSLQRRATQGQAVIGSLGRFNGGERWLEDRGRLSDSHNSCDCRRSQRGLRTSLSAGQPDQPKLITETVSTRYRPPTVFGDAQGSSQTVVGTAVHYCSVAEDLAPLDLLYLYREEVLSILNRHGIAHPRVCGLAARGAELPGSVQVEILVDVMEPRAWAAVDLHSVADAIAAVIAHRVALVHCPPGAEELLPGEPMVALCPRGPRHESRVLVWPLAVAQQGSGRGSGG